jgi:adenine deaminase
MAQAVVKLFPGTKVTIGPAIDNGFYYDFDSEHKFTEEDLLKIAVIERHKNTKKHFTGFIEGLGIRKCSIAQSIAHDSHNIIVVGVSDEEMEFAVNSLIEQEGGIVLVKDGKVIEQMPMPIAGLMSDQSGEWVDEKLTSIHEKAYTELGICGDVEPVMTLCFMSLAVIPEIKLTDMGLFDVTTFSFIPVEVK